MGETNMVVNIWQFLWGVNTLFLSIVAYLDYRNREETKEIKKALALVMTKEECQRSHAQIAKAIHTHANVGTAGEVIHL